VHDLCREKTMSDYLLEIVEGPDAGRRTVLAGPEPVEIGREVGLGSGSPTTSSPLVTRA
jgi:hypothetical protein